MTTEQHHEAVIAAAKKLAAKYNLSEGTESIKQGFILGDCIPNPNKLIQNKTWVAGVSTKVEFRHRFSNICIGIGVGKDYAELEFNLDEFEEPYITETHTLGVGGLGLLNILLETTNYM